MQIGDGHRIVETSDGKIEAQAVTRWEELQQTVLHHAEMAGVMGMQTHFRLLNYPGERIGVQEFTVAEQGGDLAQEMRQARNILQRTKPAGVTPLTDHILNIEQTIRLFKQELAVSDKKVAIVIATDGLPTDPGGDEGERTKQEFVNALKLLEDLPVWVVVRLCTNDSKVADFYNQLDSLLELSLEVLDDHEGEAREVMRHNKWLNYALPLHRCREVGFQHRLFDLLDERKFTVTEIQEFCAILFGNTAVETWPDPALQWKDFAECLKVQLAHEREHWDPTKGKMAPWINVRLLTQIYGKKSKNGAGGGSGGLRSLGCILGVKPRKTES
mmetsp:Transcript_10432/g.21442  ORF Transcript_10432/g.21442 Transcript_10432/m.21442 type:complete len:329 (+) Transcript_10432:99-1085(+)